MGNIYNTLDKKDKILFIFEIWLIVTIGFIWFYLVSNNIRPTLISESHCYFREHLGVYCPACGGTRAFEYMIYGHFLKSLFYHPFVLYAMSILLLNFISYIIYFISKANILLFSLKIKHLIYADFIFVFCFLIRNLLILYFKFYIF